MPDISGYIERGEFPATPLEQQTVIEQLRQMMASKDPVQQRLADAFQKRFGSTPLGVGAHFATGGMSDRAMTSGRPLLRYGDQQLLPLPIYKPGELDFARQLSEQLTPIQDNIAKGVGVMAGGGGALRLLRYLQSLRGGSPPPPAPLSPAGQGPGPAPPPPGGQGMPSPTTEGPFGPPPPVPEGPFGPNIPPNPSEGELPPFQWPPRRPIAPPMTGTGLLPDISIPADLSAPLGFTSRPRHPPGAENKKGEKIGGRFLSD
jgi:hypothetical protein